MEFSIQINVGETPHEALERVLEDFHKHEQGEKYVASQLGVLNWDQFYALFSPQGLNCLYILYLPLHYLSKISSKARPA